MLSTYWCQTPMNVVEKTPVGIPAKSHKVRNNWKGVKHATLIHEFVSQCKDKKWKPKTPIIDLSINGKDIAFAIPLSELKSAPLMTPAIAVTATNNGNKSMQVYVGAYSGSGAVTTTTLKGPSYTTDLDLSTEVETILGWAEASFDKLEPLRRELSTRSVADDMMQRDVAWWACRNKVIGWTKLGHLDYAMKKQKNPTAWELLLTFGEVIGRGSGQDQCHNMLRVHNFICIMCGLPSFVTVEI